MKEYENMIYEEKLKIEGVWNRGKCREYSVVVYKFLKDFYTKKGLVLCSF